jgi:hypothetical protein
MRTHIRDSNGIWTHDLSVGAVEDSRVLGSHTGGYEELYPLGYIAVQVRWKVNRRFGEIEQSLLPATCWFLGDVGVHGVISQAMFWPRLQ